jgi:hypothetical protein
MLTHGTKFGIGLHYEDMDPLKMPVVTIISYSAGFATILGAAWSKTSFAITLLRLSEGWVKWVVWYIIISVNLVLGVSATILWIQCWPVEKLWIYELKATCWPVEIVERYQMFTSSACPSEREHVPCEKPTNKDDSVYSGILDIALAILPWWIIWHVTINKREKIGALVAMSMGVLYVLGPRTLALLRLTSSCALVPASSRS